MAFAQDRSLLARFRAGEPDALAAVYRANVDDVVRTARAVLRTCAGATERNDEVASDLADVVQEVFAKAFAPDARRRFDEQRAIGPYLLQIARNAAIDHWRARRRHVLVDGDQLAERLAGDAEASARADESWASPDVAAAVERFIGSLAEEERRVHDALYVRGLSQREAAADLGVGRQVIRTVEAKLRAGLQRELARAGCLEGRSSLPRPGRPARVMS
jgi:RNA polymerase sigma factor (sigma-70 family)